MMEFSKYKFWFLIPILAIPIAVSDNFIVRERPSADIHIEGPKLIIDHDGGADDAMAIFMALIYEQYFNGPKVIGLTTTHGNVDETQSFYNSQRLLDIAGRPEVPIYRGSNFSLVISVPSDFYFGHDGLGDNDHEEIKPIDAQPQHAALSFIELTNKYPGEITIVALGALTNIALAIRLDSTFISRLSHMYVAAGHVYSPEYSSPEYNAEQDAESYYVIAKNAYPEKITFVPFSQVDSLNVSKEWRQDVLGAIPTKIINSLNKFERISMNASDSLQWSLLDPIAMGIVLNKSIVSDVKYSKNSIILCGDRRGINTNEFTIKEDANARLVNGVFKEEYQNLLFSIFSAELC
ncbi:uncharacterized protein [Choristoneura fumiferana]|uniref:uncharacterized protein n=1 Tax=Choristoneura fumiferana TaxID=7141 RepID=UPI003D15C7F3